MPGLESNLRYLISYCFYLILWPFASMTSDKTLDKLVSVLSRTETKRGFLKLATTITRLWKYNDGVTSSRETNKYAYPQLLCGIGHVLKT